VDRAALLDHRAMADPSHPGDPAQAKAKIFEYCRRKGALAVGVADLDSIDLVAPPGHRPRDVLPGVRSVISIGVGGQTQGAWSVPPKAFAYFGSTEGRGYGIAYGCSFYIENVFRAPSVYCPPDMDPEGGARIPLQSLKLHAELAGIGARSLAGDILLHPEYGYMYYASVFTELWLPPDQPLETNPCPAPSCVEMHRKTGQTPCMKFCPVQCLSGDIDAQGKQSEMRYDMAKCAEMTQQYEAVPQALAEALGAADPARREEKLFDPDNALLWYKMSVGSGGLLAQCFECMRVCPIATRAPLADPIRRADAAGKKS
jgi:epoxyqueuosine reductase QueG